MIVKFNHVDRASCVRTHYNNVSLAIAPNGEGIKSWSKEVSQIDGKPKGGSRNWPDGFELRLSGSVVERPC